tara:strand:- start:163 stop:1236 length:1074 start_codon:yes stop_codon:yes gene_type:complete
MKILYIAPINSVGGHALVSRTLLQFLKRKYDLFTIDLSFSSNHDGSLNYKRIIEVIKIFFKVFILKNNIDSIYITISQSLFGNLKDILIFIILLKRLNRTTLHLHGGSIGVNLFARYKLIKLINFFFYKKVKNIIISGNSHLNIFPKNIHYKCKVIPNFASDYIFLNKKKIKDKFKNIKEIRILFLGNMFQKKGYLKLLDAFLIMNHHLKSSVCIDFAGKFYQEDLRIDFLQKIENYKNINYLGEVTDSDKINLFHRAHIFCLPSDFLEGQPIAIIEAYASGCFVLTTNKPGISDIFEDKINGFFIRKNHPKFIAEKLEQILDNFDLCELIAKNNRILSENKFKEINYLYSIEKVLK